MQMKKTSVDKKLKYRIFDIDLYMFSELNIDYYINMIVIRIMVIGQL